MDALDGLPVGVLTPAALLGLSLWLILTGRLIPRGSVTQWTRVLDSRLDDYKDQVRELRQALRLSEEARQLETQSIADLSRSTGTIVSFIEASRLTHQPQAPHSVTPTRSGDTDG